MSATSIQVSFSKIELPYIFVAVHAERLDLLDRLDIVIGMLSVIGGGGDLVDLRADGLKVFRRRDGAVGSTVSGTVSGTVRVRWIGRHNDEEIVQRQSGFVVVLTLSQFQLLPGNFLEGQYRKIAGQELMS